jgi:raffinose/stachyose/melibiose transport system substrate-binding protein
MNKMKAVYVMMAMLLVTMALAACGGNNNGNGGSTAEPSSGAESPTAEPTKEPAKDPVTLTFLIPNTDDVTPYNQSRCRRCRAAIMTTCSKRDFPPAISRTYS